MKNLFIDSTVISSVILKKWEISGRGDGPSRYTGQDPILSGWVPPIRKGWRKSWQAIPRGFSQNAKGRQITFVMTKWHSCFNWHKFNYHFLLTYWLMLLCPWNNDGIIPFLTLFGTLLFFTFLKIPWDMEVWWKMVLSPNEPFHCRGMILGKNTRNAGRKIRVAKAKPCYILIFPGQRFPGVRNRNSSIRRNSNDGGNRWNPSHWWTTKSMLGWKKKIKFSSPDAEKFRNLTIVGLLTEYTSCLLVASIQIKPGQR